MYGKNFILFRFAIQLDKNNKNNYVYNYQALQTLDGLDSKQEGKIGRLLSK